MAPRKGLAFRGYRSLRSSEPGTAGVPNVAERVQHRVPDIAQPGERDTDDETNHRRIVLYLVGAAFAIKFFANSGPKKKGKMTENTKQAFEAIAIGGFIGVYIVLAIASDFETTRMLAVAFAWLFFLAIALQDGIKAFENMSSFIGQPKE